MLKVILGPLRRGTVLVAYRTYRDAYVVGIETTLMGALAQVRTSLVTAKRLPRVRSETVRG
jgi:hypothetical protein